MWEVCKECGQLELRKWKKELADIVPRQREVRIRNEANGLLKFTNSAILWIQAGSFSETSEQFHYYTQCKNP